MISGRVLKKIFQIRARCEADLSLTAVFIPMSLYASGSRKKMEELRKVAEEMGLKVLYSEERTPPHVLKRAMDPTPAMKKKIDSAVADMERRYGEMGRPVSPTDIAPPGSSYQVTDNLSQCLRLAYLAGRVVREGNYEKKKRKHFYYRPLEKKG